MKLGGDSRRVRVLLLLLVMAATALAFKAQIRKTLRPYVPDSISQQVRGTTVADRIKQYGPTARVRMAPYFQGAGISYPPAALVFVGLKQERKLEVWARNAGSTLTHIRTYEVLGLSGGLGPKLTEGDGQVPEGLYRIESLNPNSAFHLALKINYPNAIDRTYAARDGRITGGDIMIHGDAVSDGCLAVGNEAVEELFVVAADVGLSNLSVILAPLDFRNSTKVVTVPALPRWSAELYASLRAELDHLRMH